MTAAILLWAAAAFRSWRCLQRRHSAELRAMAVALAAIACAATLNVSAVAAGIDRPLRWPNFADALKQLGIVGAACGNQLMLIRMSRRPAPSARGWIAAAAIVSLISLVLFFAAPRVPEVAGDEFAKRYAAVPFLAESRLVVTIYAAVVLGAVAVLCRQQASADRLGRGLLILGAGAAVMVVYSALRVAYLGGYRFGYAVPGGIYDIGTVLSKIGLALVAIGTMSPGVEAWIQGRRDLRQLRPLRSFLLGHWPQVAERHSESRSTAMELRVADQVAEVQDALGLEALRRGIGGRGEEPSALSVAEQAGRVVSWLCHGPDQVIPRLWLDTPHRLTDRQWVMELAAAFRRGDRAVAAVR